jgi:hypothetical protein
MEAQAQCVVLHAEDLHGIAGHFCSRRHLGQRPAIRSPELQGFIIPAHDLKTLLVYRAMMPAAEQSKVGQRRRAAMRPVAEMMPLAEADIAARKPAALVRAWSARRKAGGIVRVRAPISTSRPASSWRITTRLASHARRRDVSYETLRQLFQRV